MMFSTKINNQELKITWNLIRFGKTTVLSKTTQNLKIIEILLQAVLQECHKIFYAWLNSHELKRTYSLY